MSVPSTYISDQPQKRQIKQNFSVTLPICRFNALKLRDFFMLRSCVPYLICFKKIQENAHTLYVTVSRLLISSALASKALIGDRSDLVFASIFKHGSNSTRESNILGMSRISAANIRFLLYNVVRVRCNGGTELKVFTSKCGIVKGAAIKKKARESLFILIRENTNRPRI